MGNSKQYSYYFLLAVSAYLCSAFSPCVKHSRLSLVHKTSSNNPTQYMNSEIRVTGLDNDVEIEKPLVSNQKRYKVYIDLATGKQKDVKFRNAYSKANTELKMSWGWFYLLFPVVLFLDDAYHFLPNGLK